MPKVLFLGANARDTTRLRVEAEVRDVKDEIARTGAREAFPVEAELAVRPEQLQIHLQQHKPDVLHFSGHNLARRDLGRKEDHDEGAGGGILLEDERGAAVAVRPAALTKLLEIVRRGAPLRCVVLNACFSVDQARDIARHVDCVIGMKHAIGDRAAIAFAVGFYRALAQEESVQTAFEYGCNEIELRGLPDKDVPELFPGPDVKPESVFLVKGAAAQKPEDTLALENALPGKGPAVQSNEGGEVLPPKEPLRDRLLRAASFAAALLFALFLAALCLPPARVEAVSPQSGAIVVAGPWLGTSSSRASRQALCAALDRERKDGEPRVQCLDLPRLGGGDAALRREALSAGASLLVLVDANGIAQILPLGKLADHEILGRGLPRVDLAVSDAAQRIPPLLRSLAQIADHAAGVKPDLIRCTTIAEDTPRGIVVLSLLIQRYARGCPPLDVALSQPPDVCDGDESSIAECWLVKYIYAYTFPGPSAEKYLSEIQDHGPEQMKGAAALLSARRACGSDRLDEAEQTATKLSESQSACVRLTASLVAACILSKLGGADAERAERLSKTEAFEGNDAAGACASPLRAIVIGERAWWRTQRDLWAEAANDYETAWSELRDQDYRLNLVEVLLRQDRIDEARRWLASTEKSRPMTDRDKIHEALLQWIAERLAGNDLDVPSALVLDTYRNLPLEQKAFNDPSDSVLLPLVCPDPTAKCALKILASPRTSDSDRLLKEALVATGAQETP